MMIPLVFAIAVTISQPPNAAAPYRTLTVAQATGSGDVGIHPIEGRHPPIGTNVSRRGRDSEATGGATILPRREMPNFSAPYARGPVRSATEMAQRQPFHRPARICISTEIDPELASKLSSTTALPKRELASLAGDGSAISSQISSAFSSALTAAGVAQYDDRGGAIVRSYSSTPEAVRQCSGLPNSVAAVLKITSSHDEGPYKLALSISQNGNRIEDYFERSAIADLEQYEARTGRSQGDGDGGPLPLGPGWSVGTDARDLARRLIDKIRWIA